MKKLRIYASIIIFSMFVNNFVTKAQLKEFELSDYKLTDYKRHSLDLNLSLTGASYFTNLDESESKLNYLNERISGTYNFVKHNRKYVGNHFFQVSTDNAFIKESLDSIGELKNMNLDNSMQISSSNAFYVNPHYFFIADFSGEIQMLRTKKTGFDTINFKTEADKKYAHYSVFPSIGIGKGRIEPIEDARHAIYILDALQEKSKLKRIPSKEEILALSKRISELKNERILDSRLHKIRELQQIDSLLNSLQILDSTDIEYFSVLNDMWAFGGSPNRQSGFEISIRYSPYYYLVKESETFENDTTDNLVINDLERFAHRAKLSLQWSKPIRHKYQSDFWFNISFAKEYDPGQAKNANLKELQADALYTFGIYPNTRTNFIFGASLQSKKSWYTITNEFETWEDELFLFTINPYISVNYYFSPQLFVNLNYSNYSNWQKVESLIEQKMFRFNNFLSIGLNYKIF